MKRDAVEVPEVRRPTQRPQEKCEDSVSSRVHPAEVPSRRQIRSAMRWTGEGS
jgi:hypothetical protein